jgi:hypothetical protein
VSKDCIYSRLEQKNKVGPGILSLVGYWHPKMSVLDCLINTETMRPLNMMNFEVQIKVGVLEVSPNGFTAIYLQKHQLLSMTSFRPLTFVTEETIQSGPACQERFVKLSSSYCRISD